MTVVLLVLTAPLHLWLAAVPAPPDVEVFLCPAHRDVQGARDGRCSLCGRAFERRVLRSIWGCPMHGHIRGEEGSDCPICRMALAAITMEVQWICPRHADVAEMSAGNCVRDGEPLVERLVSMPHGDHNPRHGGILFMAPDGFHHLEGALSPSGTFRLYLYDNFTRAVDARSARARTENRFLEPVGEGEYLELRLTAPAQFPVELVVHVQFADSVEERFDFVFPGETAGARSAEATGALVIPDAPERMVAEILVRAQRVEELMRRGAWTELYIPALEAKTLALVLAKKADRDVALPVKRIVRSAWLLDAFGDLGNRPRVEAAYELFRLGTRELEATYATSFR